LVSRAFQINNTNKKTQFSPNFWIDIDSRLDVLMKITDPLACDD